MQNAAHKESSSLTTWLIIGGLTTWILAKGFFAFFIVGDLGQPTWDYRTVEHIPGESPYAVYKLLPYPQHIRGMKGE
jgi:hypothetical protein